MIKIDKPWGCEEIIFHTENYATKFLKINKNSKLSLQYHKIKEESIYVVSGILKLTYGNNISELKTIYLKQSDVFNIPPNLIHRFEATEDAVVLLETSTNHLDDIVRISDDYNRI